jgi:hypothetical protein
VRSQCEPGFENHLRCVSVPANEKPTPTTPIKNPGAAEFFWMLNGAEAIRRRAKKEESDSAI